MLVPLVWVTAAFLIPVEASLPVVLGAMQAAALVSYGVITRAGPRSLDAAGRRVVAALTTLARIVDGVVVDGTIGGVGLIVRSWSVALRHAHAGSARVYAVAMLGGVVAMLGYFLWR